jgi:uncharacterized protein
LKIGLLSDTHSHMEPAVFEHFRHCDEVWHAGDVGDESVLTALRSFKPVRAVFGNIDTPALQHSLPEDAWFECEQLTVWMTHIGGAPPRYNPRVQKVLKSKTPDIFVCGHSHILRVVRDAQHNGMLYLNSGAAGNHGFHHVKTLLRFDVEGKTIKNMEVVELGKRGAITS